MQFTAVVLMTLLTLKLLLLPSKVSVNPAANKSRWMMMAGTIALVFQFLLQLIFGLRSRLVHSLFVDVLAVGYLLAAQGLCYLAR